MVCEKATSNICTGTATGEPCAPMLPETGQFPFPNNWIISSNGTSITATWVSLGHPDAIMRGHLRALDALGYRPQDIQSVPYDSQQMQFTDLVEGKLYGLWFRVESGTEAGRWVYKIFEATPGAIGQIAFVIHHGEQVLHNGEQVIHSGDQGWLPDWSPISGWTIANGVAVSDGSGGKLTQPSRLFAGQDYEVQYEKDGTEMRSYGFTAQSAAFVFEGNEAMTIDNMYCCPGFPELIINGDFSQGISDWLTTGTGLATPENNMMKVENTDADTFGIYQTFPVENGSIYEFLFDWQPGSGARFHFSAVSTTNPNGSDMLNINVSEANKPDEHRYQLRAISDVMTLVLKTGGAGSARSAYWGNITVRETRNLVENGEFSSDRAWTYTDPVAASISNGQLLFINPGTNRYAYQTGVLEPDENYIAVLDLDSAVSGNVRLAWYDTTYQWILTTLLSGLHTVPFTTNSDCNGNFFIRLDAAGDSAAINEVRVYKAEMVDGEWRPVGNVLLNPGFDDN